MAVFNQQKFNSVPCAPSLNHTAPPHFEICAHIVTQSSIEYASRFMMSDPVCEMPHSRENSTLVTGSVYVVPLASGQDGMAFKVGVGWVPDEVVDEAVVVAAAEVDVVDEADRDVVDEEGMDVIVTVAEPTVIVSIADDDGEELFHVRERSVVDSCPRKSRTALAREINLRHCCRLI